MTGSAGWWRWLAVLAGLMAMIAGCASPPRNIRDACALFREKDGWYEETSRSYKKWGVPVHVQLAIIHQESRFKYDAKPPRTKLFWFIPGPRPTSAFGYAQVLDDTWEWYMKQTGNWGADRDDFADAVDFIGWYGNRSHKVLGISKWDAAKQYLAYHEGHGGYRKGTYRKKKWLMKVARKVKRNAARYRTQLGRCRKELDPGGSFWDLFHFDLWPF